jgi:hypothetical protein
MTFQIVCPSCGSKLNAQEELIGQTRNCPKCSQPVFIQREEEPLTPIIVNEPSITAISVGPKIGEVGGFIEGLPERLEYRNRYFIVGADRMIAAWEPGKGWQINVGNGFSPAKKNPEAIPDQGAFVLVELVITPPNRLETLKFFKVSIRGALTSLYRDEGEILHKVDGPGQLTKNQKNALRSHLQRTFMSEALAEAAEIRQLMANDE